MLKYLTSALILKKLSLKLHPLGKEIRLMPGAPLRDVLNEYGIEFPCGGKGSCGRCRVKVLNGEIRADAFHRKRLGELALGEEWRLACLSKCHTDLELEIPQYETVIQADDTPFEFIPGKGLGIAFDLGTTTLVGQLLDLGSARILAVEKAMNPYFLFTLFIMILSLPSNTYSISS